MEEVQHISISIARTRVPQGPRFGGVGGPARGAGVVGRGKLKAGTEGRRRAHGFFAQFRVSLPGYGEF